MNKTSRKQPEQRPDAILAAAFEAFSENGYAETRIDDVAARAGISKGLVYVYFKTKEELLKAVIRAVLVPRVDQLTAEIEQSRLPASALVRGPVLAFMQEMARSRMHVVLRLLLAEGPKHPDLTAFYHDEIIARGKRLMRHIIERGVAAGEFRPSALGDFPHLLVAPVVMGLIWKALFERHEPLDTDRMLQCHIELVLKAIAATPAIAEGEAT
ncbi:MAG: TetR/AcrR family transcriptional regulator [Hyphomicrobiaceae bacterium]